MKIGVLGFESYNSLAPQFCAAFTELKHQATHFRVNAIFQQFISKPLKHLTMRWRKPFPLSQAIFDTPHQDLLVICQSFLFYENDLDIPIVYRHNDPWSPITIRNPDVLAYKNKEMNYLIRSWYPWEYKQIKKKIFCPPFINPEFFNHEREKKYSISFIGPPTETFDATYRDYIWNNMQREHEKHKLCFESKQLGDRFFDHDIDRHEYVDILEQSDFTIISNNLGTYLCRRHVEAFAAKTVPLSWVENEQSKKVQEGFGLKNGENCFFFRDCEELISIAHRINNSGVSDMELEDMKEAGYNLLLDRHLPGHRANDILKAVDQLKR